METRFIDPSAVDVVSSVSLYMSNTYISIMSMTFDLTEVKDTVSGSDITKKVK